MKSKTKNYAITLVSGAVIIAAISKKEAVKKFNAQGFQVKEKEVYIY